VVSRIHGFPVVLHGFSRDGLFPHLHLQSAGAWPGERNQGFAREVLYKLVNINVLFYKYVTESEGNFLIFLENQFGTKIALLN
jgi:hypothetical protein